MAEYRSTLVRAGALQFDAEAIRSLIGVVQKFVGVQPEITIELTGSHSIGGAAIDILLDDPYVKSKYIKSIELSCHKYDDTMRHVELSLRAGLDGLLLGTVEVDLRGDREASISARDSIERIIDGQKQWFSFLKTPFRCIRHFNSRLNRGSLECRRALGDFSSTLDTDIQTTEFSRRKVCYVCIYSVHRFCCTGGEIVSGNGIRHRTLVSKR